MSNHQPPFSLHLAALALPVMLFAAPANADSLDTWNVYLGSSVSYDKNLFHLSSSANPELLIGRSDKSDTITATTLGIKVDKPYSLQRFELDLNLVNYNYQKFHYLDFTALNYDAAWRWSLTPSLKGNLSAGRQEAMNSFADTQNYRTQNVRTNDSYRADADLDVGAGWHLLGGAFRNARKNSQPYLQERDNTITSSELGVRYDFTSGSSLGYLNRIGRGTYDNLSEPSVPLLLDNRFDQVENLLFVNWPITAKTSLNARIGELERKHEHFAARDFNGTVGTLSVNWAITGSTRLLAGWTRNLASYETANSSYTTIDRYFLNPVWQISTKTALRLRYDLVDQQFSGAGTGPAIERHDRERIALLAFDWQAMNALSLTASLTNDRRTSSETGRDFKDTIALVSFMLSF
jgi:exopolysaccharide biosynthesis operon protein EpsL